MTDNTNVTNVADGIRDHASDGSPHVHSGHTHHGWVGVLTNRWPTLLAIVFAALVVFGLKPGRDLYFLLFILALGYLVPTALNLPWAPWVVLVLSIPAQIAMMALGIEPAVGLLVVALFFVVLGFARSRVQAPWGMPLQTDGLFVLIGAEPHTAWLPSVIERDEKGYIRTGRDLHLPLDCGCEGEMPGAWPLQRQPYLLETSVPGVFAAGDVRHRSMKRVASAVGEGSTAIALIHQYLREGPQPQRMSTGNAMQACELHRRPSESESERAVSDG